MAMLAAVRQIGRRPDSAWSTPSELPSSMAPVRCTRSCSLSENAVASTSITAAPPTTARMARRLRNCMQAQQTSTSARVTQDARAPASSTTTTRAMATSSHPRRPKRSAAAISGNGARLASTRPSLRLPAPNTPLRRSAVAWPPRLQPVAACTRASSSQNPQITAMPAKVSRRPRSLATAIATSHRNGR